MDLRQLGALVAVADHRSFSAAARALHTVQSNISTHVARLERELGVALVDRATGKLTPEGEIVVSRARRIETELEALVADVAAVHSEVEGDGMRLVASLAFEGFGAAVLPASAARRGWSSEGPWKVVRVDGLTRRSVGLVRRRRGLPSAPARALTEVLKRTVDEQAHRQE